MTAAERKDYEERLLEEQKQLPALKARVAKLQGQLTSANIELLGCETAIDTIQTLLAQP